MSIPVQTRNIDIHFSFIGYQSLYLAKNDTIISSSSQVNFCSICFKIGGKYFFLIVSCIEHTRRPAFGAFNFLPTVVFVLISSSSSSSANPSSKSSSESSSSFFGLISSSSSSSGSSKSSSASSPSSFIPSFFFSTYLF